MTLCTCIQAESAVAKGATRTQPNGPRLVPIEAEPLIGETPQATLQSWLTPNPLFYVRNHYPFPPAIEADAWELTIDGHVVNPLQVTHEDIRHFPKQTMPITMECAGNNRSDLNPRVPGNPFQNGAVSTAVWSGVPLCEILKDIEMKPGAVEILFEGMDMGEPEPGAETEPYLRSLPIEIAMHPDTMLAFEMNGEPLSHEHGHPVRLIVPGWYGMASVKWLRRMTVLDKPFEGFFQTDRYIIEDDDGVPHQIGDIQIKSLISWPQQGENVCQKTKNVTGLAWSGRSHITKVEVSDDGGETWQVAELVGPRYRYAWQQWNFAWKPSAAGHYTLIARAEDENGNVQPMETRWNRLGYAVNGVRPVCVNVE